ncbi:MAG TPA: hypothetical protein VNH18_34960 [Bryobacteraceae bacterium]|nr:hypothetical protein [Bryobacteraceae bacterium]
MSEDSSRLDWPKIAATAIDLVLLYLFCVWMVGPVFAGADDISATNSLASHETASRILDEHAIQIAVRGRTQGMVIFILAVPCYFVAFSMAKRRSIGRLIVDKFTVPA